MLVNPISEDDSDMEIWLTQNGFVFLSSSSRFESQPHPPYSPRSQLTDDDSPIAYETVKLLSAVYTLPNTLLLVTRADSQPPSPSDEALLDKYPEFTVPKQEGHQVRCLPPRVTWQFKQRLTSDHPTGSP